MQFPIFDAYEYVQKDNNCCMAGLVLYFNGHSHSAAISFFSVIFFS